MHVITSFNQRQTRALWCINERSLQIKRLPCIFVAELLMQLQIERYKRLQKVCLNNFYLNMLCEFALMSEYTFLRIYKSLTRCTWSLCDLPWAKVWRRFCSVSALPSLFFVKLTNPSSRQVHGRVWFLFFLVGICRCGQMCCCLACSLKLQGKPCPLCRKPVPPLKTEKLLSGIECFSSSCMNLLRDQCRITFS